jgi:hypothetical protein
MRRLFLAALTVAALGLSLPFVAEAGPPVPDLSGAQVHLDDGCTATVTWDALKSGKPLFVQVTLEYADDGGYTQVLAEGANEFHKVKQNAGILQLELAAIAGSQPADSYQVTVLFVDRKDNALSGVISAISNCDAI